MLDYQLEIGRLRTSLRRLQVLVVVLFCTVFAFAFLTERAVSVHAGSVPEVITTKRLVVVDGAGNQRLILGDFPLDGYPGSISMASEDMFGLSIYSPPTAGSTPQPAHQIVTLGTAQFDFGIRPYVGQLEIATTDGSTFASILASPNDLPSHTDGIVSMTFSQSGQEAFPHDQILGTHSIIKSYLSGTTAYFDVEDSYYNRNVMRPGGADCQTSVGSGPVAVSQQICKSVR